MEDKSIKYETISCDFTKEKEQIDIYLEDKEVIHIFECKIDIHNNLQKVINQIKNKVKVFNNSGKIIIPWVVVYSDVSDERKKEFDKVGIKVYSNFREEIKNWRKLDKNSRNTISRILEFELEY